MRQGTRELTLWLGLMLGAAPAAAQEPEAKTDNEGALAGETPGADTEEQAGCHDPDAVPSPERATAIADPHKTHRGAAGMKDRIDDVPADMQDVGIDDSRQGEQLPLDLALIDEEGRPVKFGTAFDGKKPVLLTFVYFRCPVICKPLLEYLTDAIATLDLDVGQDYQLVTVSIDPQETRHLTKLTKQRLLHRYGRPGAEAGWKFWRGTPAAIAELTAAAGFKYKRAAETNEFAHPASLILVTPEGRVSRYLSGIPEDADGHAKNIKLSLIETADGEIGSAIDWFVLTCYHFDPSRGTYTVQAQRVMSVGGGLTTLLLAIFLLPRWLRDVRRRRAV